jgi:hypothetical protein
MKNLQRGYEARKGHKKSCPPDCTLKHGMGNHTHPRGDAAERDIPVKSLKSDIRRKVALRRVLPGGDQQDMKGKPVRASLYRTAAAASGEISALMRDAEDLIHREHADRLKHANRQMDEQLKFAGKDVGMARGDGLYESVFGTDSPEMGDMATTPKRSKEQVNYRYAADPQRSCGECVHFREPAACELVAGMILKTDTCDLFKPADGGTSMRETEVRVREALKAFHKGEGRSPAEEREAAIKKTLARELRVAKTEAERRAATRRYKAALRRANEQEFESWSRTRRAENAAGFRPLPKNNPPDFHRDAADAGD